MEALNFSSGGTRWRVTVVGEPGESLTQPRAGQAPEAGLLFVADDGERRFLALAPDALPSIAVLREKSNAELGRLAELAVGISS